MMDFLVDPSVMAASRKPLKFPIETLSTRLSILDEENILKKSHIEPTAGVIYLIFPLEFHLSIVEFYCLYYLSVAVDFVKVWVRRLQNGRWIASKRS